MSRHLTTVRNEVEAEIVLSIVRGAGVSAWESNDLGGRPGSGGPRDIYVEDADLERARQALKEAEAVDQDELARLAEGQPPTPD